MKKLAVFVSGTGTLLEAMIGADISITVVVADRPCRGLEIAREAGIPIALVPRTDFSGAFNRERYTLEIIDAIESYQIGVIAMAGFMTVLGKAIFERFHGVILNTHPSLLPKYPGAKAVRDALAAGERITGCTVHRVIDESVDTGPIIAQAEVVILPGDTIESLHERIKEKERILYPETIRKMVIAA